MKYIILPILLLGCSIPHKSDVVCTMTWVDNGDTTYSCTGKDITKGLADRKYKEFLRDQEDQKKEEKRRRDQKYLRERNKKKFNI